MNLNILWFILIAVLFIGFFFLEGFDYGVGMLLPFLGKNEEERSTIVNTIGPFWDGNEVWLITAGGAMFAAFPNWYATMFSGFYLPLVLMLVALIVRGVAFEFRHRETSPVWRTFWDWMIFVGSALPGLLWGVALANLIEGVPIDAKMNYVGGFFNLLNPFALLGGLSFVAMFLLHGATFLALKTEGILQERAQKVAGQVWFPTVILIALFIGSGYFVTSVFKRLGVDPGLAPIGAGMALLLGGWLIQNKRFGWAFLMTGVTIVLSATTVALGMFPNVMISSLNPAWSLTIYNASSSPYTLTVMSIIAITLVPFVLAYQACNYLIFRKRVIPARATLSHE
jgi:cytochrome bd ubiquinol oxidase subunit II